MGGGGERGDMPRQIPLSGIVLPPRGWADLARKLGNGCLRGRALQLGRGWGRKRRDRVTEFARLQSGGISEKVCRCECKHLFPLSFGFSEFCPSMTLLMLPF